MMNCWGDFFIYPLFFNPPESVSVLLSNLAVINTLVPASVVSSAARQPNVYLMCADGGWGVGREKRKERAVPLRTAQLPGIAAPETFSLTSVPIYCLSTYNK